MGKVRDPSLSAADQGNRWFDVAHRPQCEREVMHRQGAGVRSKAKSQIVVAAGLEQGERALQVISRLRVITGEPASGSGAAMGDAGLG